MLVVVADGITPEVPERSKYLRSGAHVLLPLITPADDDGGDKGGRELGPSGHDTVGVTVVDVLMDHELSKMISILETVEGNSYCRRTRYSLAAFVLVDNRGDEVVL